jgi:hypothetical protein
MFARMDPPWGASLKDFVGDVRKAVGDIIVSHGVSRKVQGKLHKDKAYGRIWDLKKGRMVYVQRVLLAFITEPQIRRIVDCGVRKRVEDKITELGGFRNRQNPFQDRKNHPCLEITDKKSSRKGQLIPIHKVRIARDSKTLFPLYAEACKNCPYKAQCKKPSQRIRCPIFYQCFVDNESNHHVEIIEVAASKKWEAKVVTTFEAMQRLRDGKPIVQHEHGPGRKFICSLSKGDSVLMSFEGKEHIYRLMSLSQGDFQFNRHWDSSVKGATKKKPERIRSADDFKEMNLRKLLITPFGEVRWAND